MGQLPAFSSTRPVQSIYANPVPNQSGHLDFFKRERLEHGTRQETGTWLYRARQRLIPIGKSEPVSIVWRQPPELPTILVSPSEALFSSRFVLCLVPPKIHAGMSLVLRFDRVEQTSCWIDPIHPCGLTWSSLGTLPVGRWLALACARR
jgi:hypothetical protein